MTVAAGTERLVVLKVRKGCVHEQADVIVGDRVVRTPTFAPDTHDLIRAEEAQGVRDRRLAHSCAGLEVRDGPLAGFSQCQQEPQPPGIREHSEDVHHHVHVIRARCGALPAPIGRVRSCPAFWLTHDNMFMLASRRKVADREEVIA
jgi:hypothetical protein